MNDLLKQRILRALETLSDERGYQVLDYVEFLESKYAQRQRPGGLFAKLTETVEDTMRAGKLPVKAISGTMGIMDSAAKVMKGLAAAGQAVVDEAVKGVEGVGGAPGRGQVAGRESRVAGNEPGDSGTPTLPPPRKPGL